MNRFLLRASPQYCLQRLVNSFSRISPTPAAGFRYQRPQTRAIPTPLSTINFRRPVTTSVNPPKIQVGSSSIVLDSPRLEVDRHADTTGFIPVGPNEGLLFFDNVFPLKTAIWDIRHLVSRLAKTTLASHISHYLPPKESLPAGFSIVSIHPRHKDGGAFIKFSYNPPPGEPTLSHREIEAIIAKHLEKQNIRPWFSPFRPLRAYLVEGTPWTEDLHRFPSQRLRVEFVTPGSQELSQESLYDLFRSFGKIADITIPPPVKDMPRYALVQYLSVRSATAAKNCLHRARYVEPGVKDAEATGGTLLRVLYERTIKAHWLRDWLFNHPRIVIPLLAAIIGTVTIAVFDPVRTWFIKAKITGVLSLKEYESVAWFWRHTIAHLQKPPSVREDPASLLEERKSIISALKSWLLDSNDTFIIVQGPRGSGKKELVLDHVLGKSRKNVLVIDCEPIVEAHGDSATIAATAAQVGYRPVFSWMNTITSLADLAAQGTIGTSAGFSQTLEIQFNKILQNTAMALKQVAVQDRSPNDKDAYLSDEEYLTMHPEKRPVIVIDNFLHSQGSEGAMVYDRLASWAALLVEANVAHIIFLTNDGSYSKSLSKSLPDRVFRSVQLGDASPESAKQYVLNQIGGIDGLVRAVRGDAEKPIEKEEIERELDECISVLGGRLTDLEALTTRIRSGGITSSNSTAPSGEKSSAVAPGGGMGPRKAVEQIVKASAEEISKLYLSPPSQQHHDPKTRKWTTEQAWFLISVLTQPTDNVLLATTKESKGQTVAVATHLTSNTASTTPQHGAESSPSNSSSSSSSSSWLSLTTTKKSTPPDPLSHPPSSSSTILHRPPISISYTSLLLHPLFKTSSVTDNIPGEDALYSLSHSDLITILPSPRNSRPYSIHPGRPVYRASFAQLMSDPVLKAKMDFAVLKKMVKVEEEQITKWEGELEKLAVLVGGMPEGGKNKEGATGGKGEVERRMEWLGKRVGESQRRVEEWEERMGALKRVMKEEF